MIRRLTMAQALITFLKSQYVERDGIEQRFFAGCFGIFGHGNIAGIGQALQESPDFPYTLFRNEQGAVHAAVGFARMRNRLGAIACTSSIGPGATNMVTGAALATINRLPVLLLPGDIFAKRVVAPVLQQLESEHSQDTSVNDCFRPVSRYWDRIYRPEQLITALPEVMRVLTSPAETGAVTLCLPQDVQTEAFDYPAELFDKRVWQIQRPRADVTQLERATRAIRESKRPLIVAGGGVIYADACRALAKLSAATGIPVAETQAGKGSIPWTSAECVGAVGATGTLAANLLARDADLIIGVGTRYSDFTTASKTAFKNPHVRFVNLNVVAFDACKHNGLSVVADARAALEELGPALADYEVPRAYHDEVVKLRADWTAEVDRLIAPQDGPLPSQAAVIGAMNAAMRPCDVIVNAAGSAPGDFHKLWRPVEPRTYHIEYGYSCMGYEIPAALGIKLAAPERDVYVLIGDGSYLMMSSDLVTAVQEGVQLVIVLIDNHGFASIGSLSQSLGSGGFGTAYTLRPKAGDRAPAPIPTDFVANAQSLGAKCVRARSIAELKDALAPTKSATGPVVIVVETDRKRGVPGYESWWDVAVAEVSTMESVQQARAAYERAVSAERHFLEGNRS